MSSHPYRERAGASGARSLAVDLAEFGEGAVPTGDSEAGTWCGPGLSWPELVEDGLQLLAGGRFFGWVSVRVGLGRVLP